MRLAVEQGLAEAQSELGVRYGNGQGVPQDYIQAYMWYNLAASNSSGGLRLLAVKGRNQAAKEMTPEDISEAQRLTSEWKPKEPSRE